MSDQEMQFADPDWKPTQPLRKQAGTQGSSVYTPQPVNDDFRKDAQQLEETPSEEGYTGLRPFTGATSQTPRQTPYQYQRMPNRRRRRGAWFWIIIAILFFSLMGGGWGALGSIGERSVTVDKQFNVSGTPKIVINDASGNIHVHQGSSLDIQAIKQSTLFDDPNNIKVTFTQTGSTITVNIDPGSSFLSSRSVDINITIPQTQNATLDLHTNSGDIGVNDTSGQMNLSTDSGSINTTNDILAANSILHASSGDIDSTRDTFSGQANISTSSGDVSMEGDALNGPAKVSTSSGNIHFDGSIASSGLYQFGSDSGDISIGLPSDANFQVQASTNSGSIDARDFSSINVQENNPGSGSQATGIVGTPPGASLNINTNKGDITLQQNSQ